MGKATALFSVIFPANVLYLTSFLDSLSKQTDQDFDVLLVVDGVDDIDVRLKKHALSFSVKTFHCTGSIAEIRRQGLKWLGTLSYTNVIFQDADDLLHDDRVFVCKKYLAQYNVVVNDLVPFTDQGLMGGSGFWENRLQHETEFSQTDIQTCNFVGLGNTAVRTSVINEIHIPDQIKVVDWFLFYHWLDESPGIFIHDGKVLYRQHDHNLAGLQVVSVERLRNIVDVKLVHYASLVQRFSELMPMLQESEHLKLKLKDARFAQKSVDYLNTKRINYFWWEETEYLHE
ncbi:glycosyltransferase family protein [Pseudochryseolinea flava]|uniref:Glycosyltransferase 2-like domain-containing protein n=1 Tax=Pseudochryseolinea flava TaxID=2059302 RepID=A0A364Y3E7_9BACT|nr:hypothetical protein [Pseudochryseolinea flava]RAW01306.1 hypothetical protein DQQ10_10380 [Pseudochryseolinea flava]